MIIGRSVQLFYTISALRNPIKSSISKVAGSLFQDNCATEGPRSYSASCELSLGYWIFNNKSKTLGYSTTIWP